MKIREKRLLSYIVENQNVQLHKLLEIFQISRRTLYYDIENINFKIQTNGKIKSLDSKFFYVGNYEVVSNLLKENEFAFSTYEKRKMYIVEKIFEGQSFTLDYLAQTMDLAKNTVKQTIDQLRQELKRDGIELLSKPKYHFVGNEKAIRDYFIIVIQEHDLSIHEIQDDVSQFNQGYGLNLTDDSLVLLSKLIAFIKARINVHAYVEWSADEVKKFDFYNGVKTLLACDNESECLYLASYIASLSTLGYQSDMDEQMQEYVQCLIREFERHCAIELDDQASLMKHMTRHIASSYYRIKYRFPIYNPLLHEMIQNHPFLFQLVKRILQDQDYFREFKGIRDEEIGFIATYFGSYLKRSEDRANKNRVVIVCPSGLMISKSLEMQLYRYIPGINIVGVIPVRELESFHETFDAIVSTIPIVGYDNVIVVNPILTKVDKQRLVEQLLDIQSDFRLYQVDEILSEVRQYATIHDENKLRRSLEKIIYQEIEKERNQPMLKEILTKDRIQVVDNVDDWEDAIRLAASPLVSEQVIELSYVERMIASVHEHGPYIVLADGFALPHASPGADVHAVSMALLIVKQPVDLEGKPVQVFNVLATVDQQAHLKALSALSELLMEEANLEVFRQGDKDEIVSLIQKEEERR